MRRSPHSGEAMAEVAAAAAWKLDGLQGLDRGSRVWWRASATEWQPATIVSVAVPDCTIALDSAAGQGMGQVSRCPKPKFLCQSQAIKFHVHIIWQVSWDE